MPEIVRFQSRERSAVEQAWAQFAPSARLHRAEPELRLDWFSAALEHVGILEYRLSAAAVRSSVRPEGQLFACSVRSARGSVRSGRQELASGVPWLSDGREVTARWDEEAHVRAVVLDPGWAQETARRILGDDRLLIRVTDPAPADRRAAAHWSRTVARLAEEAEAAIGHP